MNEDFIPFELALKLKEKGFDWRIGYAYDNGGECMYTVTEYDVDYIPAPTITQVLKWLRTEKFIDVEIHAATDMLGTKAYMPYVSTYTTFKLYDDDDEIRYRQKKVTTLQPLPNEIIPAHSNFPTWEKAAIDAIEFVIKKYL